MIPYQEATEAIRGQSEMPIRALKTAGSLALSGTAGVSALKGASLLKRALPFFNKYIPQDVAIKGLNKIDPRFGKFINKAMSEGKTFEEIKEFIQSLNEKADQIVPETDPTDYLNASGFPKKKEDKTAEKKEEKTIDKRNLIQQYSDELFQFIENEINKGRPVIEAGALAQNDKRFTKIIDKLTKDHKTTWSNILQTIFGSGHYPGMGMTQPQALNKFNERVKKPGVLQQETERFEQGYGKMPKELSQADTALLAAMEKILRM